MEFEQLYRELATNAETIRALVSGISQEEAQVKPTPEDWSILEVMGHLFDEERDDFRERLSIILERSKEEFPPIHPGAWVTERGYNQRELAEVLDFFLTERQRSLAWLKELVAPDWDKPFTYPYGTITAGELFSSWVAHDTLHMRQLVELRHARIVALSQPYSTGYAGDW